MIENPTDQIAAYSSEIACAVKEIREVFDCSTLEAIFARLTHKDELFGVLGEMYNAPLLSLLDEPEQSEGGEGNLSWKSSL